MKFLKVALLSSVAMTMTAHTAHAEGPWDGFWIGGGIGGQFAIGDAFARFAGSGSGSGSGSAVSGRLDGDLGAESFFGTVGAGYDLQFNESLVAGIFGDYSFASNATANLSGEGDFSVGCCSGGGFDIDASFTIGDSWFIGGRLGYLVTPETLFYVLVGYSEFDVSAKLDAGGGAGCCFGGGGFGSSSGSEGGVTVGAGAETMIIENISGRLEYRYTNIGSFGVTEPDEYDGSSEFVLEEFESNWDPHIHSIRGIIAFHF